MTEVQVRRTVLKDFEITTWEMGQGPTLLFLHGGGGAAGMFAGPEPAAFLQTLAQSYRVLVPEHPGFGLNERPDWLDNIHDLAYFYLDYLKEFDLRDVHLVGQSLGGWLALEMAVRDTGRLATLTLAGAAGLKLDGVPKGDLFLWTREDFARNMFANPAASEAFLAREPTPDQHKATLRNNETLALLAWEPRLVDPDLHKWLHRIDRPTHVVWAADDRVLPKAYGEALAGLIGGAALTIVPETGHLLHLDQPQRFAETVHGFIQEKTR